MLLLFLPLYAQEVQPTTPSDKSPLVIKIPTPQTKPTPQPTPKVTQSFKIESLIKSVQEAPDAEKRLLINQLKQELKTMNQESRYQAMKRLKHSFAKERGEGEKRKHPATRQQQHTHHNAYQQGNHQPKFRHLHLGRQDGSGSPRSEGQNAQGNGQK